MSDYDDDYDDGYEDAFDDDSYDDYDTDEYTSEEELSGEEENESESESESESEEDEDYYSGRRSGGYDGRYFAEEYDEDGRQWSDEWTSSSDEGFPVGSGWSGGSGSLTPWGQLSNRQTRPDSSGLGPAVAVPPLDPTTEVIWNLMGSVLSNIPAYSVLLKTTGEKAQTTLDIMQKLLDKQDTPRKLRRLVLHATKRLCKVSKKYPSYLTLQDVSYEPNPVAGGSFSDMWRGSYRNQPVCLKVLRVYQNADVEHLIEVCVREAVMWNNLLHPNVLPFYGIYRLEEPASRICLVSPWMENGNVTEYLKSDTEAPRVPLIQEILTGLEYLHKYNIIHGDLKGANILVSRNGTACIADFGVSTVVDDEILQRTSTQSSTWLGGSVRWAAPELMAEGDEPKPSFWMDMYAMGCVMYEVLTGKIPFFEFSQDVTVISNKMRGARPSKPPPEVGSELTEEIWELVENCWSKVPEERPMASLAIEKLKAIPRNAVTIARVDQRRSRPEVQNELSPQSLRTTGQGHTSGFSTDEIELIKEYARLVEDNHSTVGPEA